MDKGIFITGINTNSGKTYISRLMINSALSIGVKACYYKAAMSGGSADVDYIKRMTGIKEEVKNMCPYILSDAVSPHLAAEKESKSIDLDVIIDGYNKLAEKYEHIIVEGAGGICCPLNLKKENGKYGKKDDCLWLFDVVKALDLSVILVTNARLGSINNTFLSSYFLEKEGFKLSGVIVNMYDEKSEIERDNVKVMRECLGYKKVVTVAKNGTFSLDLSSFIQK